MYLWVTSLIWLSPTYQVELFKYFVIHRHTYSAYLLLFMIEVKYPFCHWRPPNALFVGFFWFLKQYIINSDSCGYSSLCFSFFLLQRFTLPQESHSTTGTGKSLPFKVCVSHHFNFLSGLVTYHFARLQYKPYLQWEQNQSLLAVVSNSKPLCLTNLKIVSIPHFCSDLLFCSLE